MNLACLFTVVAMLGAQSALFSPSKMGIIPELLPPEKISVANGLFGLTTVSATVIGMAGGSWLSRASGLYGKERWWLSAVVVLAHRHRGVHRELADPEVAGSQSQSAFSLGCRRAQTWRDLRTLASNRPLLRVALGVVFFWSVGALAQLNVDQFAAEGGALHETDKVPLLIALVVGVGVGQRVGGHLVGRARRVGDSAAGSVRRGGFFDVVVYRCRHGAGAWRGDVRGTGLGAGPAVRIGRECRFVLGAVGSLHAASQSTPASAVPCWRR